MFHANWKSRPWSCILLKIQQDISWNCKQHLSHLHILWSTKSKPLEFCHQFSVIEICMQRHQVALNIKDTFSMRDTNRHLTCIEPVNDAWYLPLIYCRTICWSLQFTTQHIFWEKFAVCYCCMQNSNRKNHNSHFACI